jgi:hypothetical protein
MEFKQLPSPPPAKPATREEVSEFLQELQMFRSKGKKPVDEKAINEFLAKQPLGSLQGIARRIMMDILKSPTTDPLQAAPATGERKRGTAAKKQRARPAGKAARSRKSPRAAAPRSAGKKKKTARRKAPQKKTSRKKQPLWDDNG